MGRPSKSVPQSRDPAHREILVVRLANAVGDIVMMRPALQFLIDRGYPIVATGRPFAAPLLRGLELDFEPLPESREGFHKLRAATGAYALTLRSSFRSSRELRRAGFRVIGFRSDLRSVLLWRSMARPRGRHKIEEYHRLAEYAAHALEGLPAPGRFIEPAHPRIELPEGELEQARLRLEEAGVASPYVLCCPTVAGHHPPGFKLWPSFPQLYVELERLGLSTLTCPGPGEEERCLELSPRGVVLEGTTLATLAAMLAQASVVVSNDTGTMHLAAAVGAPTIGLFGDTDPTRYAPKSERSVALGQLGAWPTLEQVLTTVQQVLKG